VRIVSIFILIGLGLSVLAYFLPRLSGPLVLADGETSAVDDDVALQLREFSIPTYPSGRPRQYVCDARVSEDRGGSWRDVEISVNHPLRVKGWWIYQMSYSQEADGTLVTQLQCVREPGFPLAVAGWCLTILGALGLCFAHRPPPSACVGRGRRILGWACALAAICLPLFIIGRAVLRPEPVPALQSVLMAPHVAAYAASYLIMLFAAFGIGRRLMTVGFLLMTCGLVLGALWGKIVWGAWWQCDPKETWSLLTWLVYAAYFLFATRPKAELFLRILGAVFVVFTLTWVNFSRFFVGVHSYA